MWLTHFLGYLGVFFNHGAMAPQWAKASSLSRIQDHIQLDTPHLVGLLWMSDQLIAETSN